MDTLISLIFFSIKDLIDNFLYLVEMVVHVNASTKMILNLISDIIISN